MGSLALPQILVSVQETTEDRFGTRGQKEGHSLRWLVGFNSRTGGQTLRGALKILVSLWQGIYTPSLHPPRTCTELRCLWGLQWGLRARSKGQNSKRVREGACSTTTGLHSTEAVCFRLQRDPDAGRHTCGAHIHVHIEDSKSLPSLAQPQVWQRWERALCGLIWAEAKKLLPSVSSNGGGGGGRGKGLKIKANLTTPMTTVADHRLHNS